MCLPVLDHILSVAGLVVALAVAQLIIVPVLMPERRSPLESARQPRLLSSSVILLSLFPKACPSLKLSWLPSSSLYIFMFLIISHAAANEAIAQAATGCSAAS